MKQRILAWLVPIIVTNLQRLYGLTLRREDIGREEVEKLRARKQAWIYAIWHTNVFFSSYLNRRQQVYVMISASRDGEWIDRVNRSFGNRSIRGSSSRGGFQALKQFLGKLRAGHPGAITPDGPRGPCFRVQSGLISAAAHSGVPIIPFHYEASRQWLFAKAWDRHRLPKPFSRLVVHYGEPIYLQKVSSDEEVESARRRVEEAMLENMRRCQIAARGEVDAEDFLPPQPRSTNS